MLKKWPSLLSQHVVTKIALLLSLLPWDAENGFSADAEGKFSYFRKDGGVKIVPRKAYAAGEKEESRFKKMAKR